MNDDRNATFTVDRAYLEHHAREAVRNFFAPLTWPLLATRWIAGRMVAGGREA